MTATKVITESDTFTATVLAPQDGDAADGATFQAAPQALANRTKYLNERLIERANYFTDTFDNGTPTGTGNPFTFTTSGIENGGFTFQNTDREVRVPEAGVYEIHVSGNVASDDATSPNSVLVALQVGGVAQQLVNTYRNSAVTTQASPFILTTIVSISTPSTEQIRVVPTDAGATLTPTGRIVIKRIA